jgi:hypothetical protein
MDRDPTAASTHRIVTRALFLVVPLVVLAFAAPKVVSLLRVRAGGEPEATPRERPPTDAEVRESAQADRRLAELEREGLSRSSTLAPAEAAVDATGERVRRFEGFGVSVESTPPGAWVRANGEALGTTPLVASVPCTPGAELVLEIGGPRLRTVRRAVTCREDTLVEVSVKLAR